MDELVSEHFDTILLSELLYVASPLCVPWCLDDCELLALTRLTKTKLSRTGEAWVTYGNRENRSGAISSRR